MPLCLHSTLLFPIFSVKAVFRFPLLRRFSRYSYPLPEAFCRGGPTPLRRETYKGIGIKGCLRPYCMGLLRFQGYSKHVIDVARALRCAILQGWRGLMNSDFPAMHKASICTALGDFSKPILKAIPNRLSDPSSTFPVLPGNHPATPTKPTC